MVIGGRGGRESSKEGWREGGNVHVSSTVVSHGIHTLCIYKG